MLFTQQQTTPILKLWQLKQQEKQQYQTVTCNNNVTSTLSILKHTFEKVFEVKCDMRNTEAIKYLRKYKRLEFPMLS